MRRDLTDDDHHAFRQSLRSTGAGIAYHHGVRGTSTYEAWEVQSSPDSYGGEDP